MSVLTKTKARTSPSRPLKAASGITGFDEMTGGGLPTGRTTLLSGGPGSGKTILGLSFLVNGARKWAEPGIFVCFEEASARVIANAGGFGWNIPALVRAEKMFFLDAQPTPDLIQSGNFEGISEYLSAYRPEPARQNQTRSRLAFSAASEGHGCAFVLLTQP